MKTVKSFLLVLICFLLLSISVSAVLQKEQMKVFAVTSTGEGVSATMSLSLQAGTGKVWVGVEPLVGTSTQTAAKTAIGVAKNYSSKVNQFDFLYEIQSNASTVEGPSAGAAMTLLAISMLEEKPLNAQVALTGTITPEGKVGAVGGVFKKAEEASKSGIKLFLIPKGEAQQKVKLDNSVQTVNLVSYGLEKWNMKVVEVEDMDEVLKLAFSDIGKIDVNVQASIEVKEFIPEGIPLASNLQIMHELTASMLTESKSKFEEAKTAVGNSLLQDADVIDFLLSTLNDIEKSLKEAESLYDNNYLYSSANLAFVCKVQSLLVEDIASNPSLLDKDSTLFNLKLQNLSKDISTLKQNLGAFVPVDQLEWHISAQQRLSWAELNVNKLLGKEEIIVQIGGSAQDETANAIKRIQDYEFAVGWFEIAGDFYEKTLASNKRIKENSQFEKISNELIVEAEDSLKVFSGDTEDIQRRLDTAKMENNREWFMSSAFNAASALALMDGENAVSEKDLNALHSLLESKIEELENKISSSEYEFVWPVLYLDHAKYFFNSAKYYESEGYNTMAIEKLKSGISLAIMADYLFNAVEPMNAYYANLPADSYAIGNTMQVYGGGGQIENDWLLAIALTAIVVALIVFIFVLAVHSRKERKTDLTIDEQINRVKDLQHKIDSAFADGKMSEAKHSELVQKYSQQLSLLQRDRFLKSSHLIELDKLNAELHSFKSSLRKLDEQLKKKLILKSDYNNAVREFSEKIEDLRQKIAEKKDLLKKEKDEAMQKTSELMGYSSVKDLKIKGTQTDYGKKKIFGSNKK